MADEAEKPEAAPHTECGWVKLYAKCGAFVTIPVTEKPLDYVAMATNVEAMIAAGFSVAAAGLDVGEEKDTVAFVLHGKHAKDGKTTPVVLLWNANEAYKWSFLKVYLNRPEDVEAFEYAAGVRLTQLPLYIGKDKPERGADADVDKFIIPIRKHFGVVFKKNPAHNPDTEEGKMKPARLFLRWADQKPEAANGATANGKPEPTVGELDGIRAKWKGMMAIDPPVDVFNKFAADNWEDVPLKMRDALRKAIDAHAQAAGWWWDGSCYVRERPAQTKIPEDNIPF